MFSEKIKSTIIHLFIVLLVILSVGSIDDCSFAKKTADGPKIFLPETHYSFGMVHEGEDVRHQFIIKNTGGSPLKIIDVKTD